MSNYTVTNIRRATLNGRAVKLFDVRDGGVFCGQFSAPARTANRDLLAVALENIQAS